MWTRTGKLLRKSLGLTARSVGCLLACALIPAGSPSPRRMWVFCALVALVQNGQPAGLCRWSLFPVLWTFFGQAGAEHYGLVTRDRSKLTAWTVRFHCWPLARLASAPCEGHAERPMIFLLDGDFFLTLFSFFFLFILI